MGKGNEQSVRINPQRERRELAKDILKGLAIGGLVVASFALPNLPQIFGLLGINDRGKRFRAKRAIDSLVKKKLIKITDKNGKQIMEITENGQKKVLEFKFDEMLIERPKKWDGMWRVIMFDIPEKQKRGRDALSRKLREMEFYPLQKSVFVFPFKCKDELDFIGEVFNIGEYLHYFAAKSISNEEKLKDYYDL